MITGWRLSNFKSVRKSENLAFGPLTIFAGANSSGKSTWIQSLLLVAQTLSHKISSRSVVLNGSLARLGQFDDLKSYGAEANQISIGFDLRPNLGEDRSATRDIRPAISDFGRRRYLMYPPGVSDVHSVSFDFSFDADPSSADRELLQLQPRLFSATLGCTVGISGQERRDAKLVISRSGLTTPGTPGKLQGLDPKDMTTDLGRSCLDYDVDLDSRSLSDLQEEHTSAIPVGCILRHFLPRYVTVRVDSATIVAEFLVALLTSEIPYSYLLRRISREDSTIPAELLVAISECLGAEVSGALFRKKLASDPGGIESRHQIQTLSAVASLVRALSDSDRQRLMTRVREVKGFRERVHAASRKCIPPGAVLRQTTPPECLMLPLWYLDTYFSNAVRYLGPLRDDPKALYPLSVSADPSDVGLRGEFTAAVLNLHRDHSVQFIPTSCFESGEAKPEPTTKSLEIAVTDWLKYLGVADSVRTHDRGKLGHEMKVLVPGLTQEHDLTHVGVGVSQVLPILVTCLLAGRDDTLIFEQPELHLHPKVQTLLGDFFLSMAMLGRQCVIETHSEYLINQLRFRAASSKDEPAIHSLVKMYFVEKQDGGSSFREVLVNQYGAITDWPRGFFDQSRHKAEEILRAATQKRMAEKKPGEAKDA